MDFNLPNLTCIIIISSIHLKRFLQVTKNLMSRSIHFLITYTCTYVHADLLVKKCYVLW